MLTPLAASQVRQHGATERVVYRFKGGQDGSLPEPVLIDVGGELYGTTAAGGGGGCANSGATGCGTVFRVSPSGKEDVLHAFGNGADGALPESSLIAFGGLLYGTTNAGSSGACSTSGITGCGTVFTIDQKDTAHSVLYSFKGGADGAYPYALTNLNAKLYGTTAAGGGGSCSFYGTKGCGAVYTVDPSSGREAVVYAFKGGSDGAVPYAGLTDVNGALYGTTYSGGAHGSGTVFKIDPATGKKTVIYAFAGGADGGGPFGNLIDVNGTLYGTTTGGGTGCKGGCGTVFEVSPLTRDEHALYSFKGAVDGSEPTSGLINDNGQLFGVTAGGGVGICTAHGGEPPGCGTVFEVNASTGAEKVLYSFKGGADGRNPESGLTEVGGVLYGTTFWGGGSQCTSYGVAVGCGTVFELQL
ncbi:MAG: hypothetical protein JO199_12255 [Candidatus Eremiobacteraeota bacterium]|nr:hypothetical protein [Candidatus Eremiobacteraeota bacterium]